MTIEGSAELSSALRGASWAQGLSDADLAAVAQSVYERHFAAGSVVIRKGEPSDHWIGVVSGMVKVDTMEEDGRSTTFIGVSRGGWLGEGSLLKGELRPYEVVALQESRIAFMPRKTFIWLYESNLSFNHFLISQLNARLSQFISVVERARMGDTSVQVAFGLASLFNPLLNPSADRKVRISQEKLGKLCGLSRQIVSSGLHRLQQVGLIAVEYGQIRVMDISGLNKVAGIAS
ncbi:Crp/Fnr family transcriptional regulator [Variovorax paradoxus]|nr:Crp/Fnr family transcriptional regulator [Variovorax paradoxus]